MSSELEAVPYGWNAQSPSSFSFPVQDSCDRFDKSLQGGALLESCSRSNNPGNARFRLDGVDVVVVEEFEAKGCARGLGEVRTKSRTVVL